MRLAQELSLGIMFLTVAMYVLLFMKSVYTLLYEAVYGTQ